jgi:hypothetical protein
VQRALSISSSRAIRLPALNSANRVARIVSPDDPPSRFEDPYEHGESRPAPIGEGLRNVWLLETQRVGHGALSAEFVHDPRSEVAELVEREELYVVHGLRAVIVCISVYL